MNIQRPGQKILTIGNPGLQVISPRGGAAAWTPASISGLKLWIDFSDVNTLFTDAGSTNVSSDGDLIYQANDKSGLGNHLTQSTEGYRPAYKTYIQNSLSASLYDGADDNLIRGDSLGLSGSPLMTVIIVAKDVGDDGYLFTIGTGTGGIIAFANSGGASYRYGNGNEIFGTASFASTSICSWVRKATTYAGQEYYHNGSSISATSSSSGTSTPTVPDNNTQVGYIGPAAPGAYIMEVVVYSGVLSEANRQAVEVYLNSKWNVY